MQRLFLILILTIGYAMPSAAERPDAESKAWSDILRKPLPVQECEPPRESSEEIVVCGRGAKESERYRVTDPNAPFDPDGNVLSVARERSRWVEGGDTGIGSCSAVGPGGFTGCMLKQWRRNQQQRGTY